MLEKLSRLLKIKQRLRLDPVSDNYVFVEVDKFSVSRIEVSVVFTGPIFSNLTVQN